MKNTNRVRRNHPTKSASLPVKNHQQPERATLGNTDTVSLMLFSELRGSSIAQLELTPEQVDGLIELAESRQMTWTEIFKKMVALMLVKDDGLGELEMTCTKVKSLLQLLYEKFDYIAINRDGTDFTGPEADKFCAGIQYLVNDAKVSLDGAFTTVRAAARPKLEDVAAAA